MNRLECNELNAHTTINTVHLHCKYGFTGWSYEVPHKAVLHKEYKIIHESHFTISNSTKRQTLHRDTHHFFITLSRHAQCKLPNQAGP